MRANGSASGMRGRTACADNVLTNRSRSRPAATTVASMSIVSRGTPWAMTATPPMIIDGVPSSWRASRNARSASRKPGRGATVTERWTTGSGPRSHGQPRPPQIDEGRPGLDRPRPRARPPAVTTPGRSNAPAADLDAGEPAGRRAQQPRNPPASAGHPRPSEPCSYCKPLCITSSDPPAPDTPVGATAGAPAVSRRSAGCR